MAAEQDAWWNDREVCILGASGVLGTRLTARLTECGCRRLVAFSRTPDAVRDDTSMQVQVGDLIDAEAVGQAVRGCDVVFHLAAMNSNPASHPEALQQLATNVLGSLQVAKACRRNAVSKLIYASTGYVYGTSSRIPRSERHRPRPDSIYAASKLGGEIAIRGAMASCGMHVTIARIANVYGRETDARTVFWTAIRQAAGGGPVRLRSLAPVRDFIHIDDVIEGMMRIAASSTSDGLDTVNISTGRGLAIGELALQIAEEAERLGGFGKVKVENRSTDSSGIDHLVLSNDYLTELTEWTPKADLLAVIRSCLLEKASTV